MPWRRWPSPWVWRSRGRCMSSTPRHWRSSRPRCARPMASPTPWSGVRPRASTTRCSTPWRRCPASSGPVRWWRWTPTPPAGTIRPQARRRAWPCACSGWTRWWPPRSHPTSCRARPRAARGWRCWTRAVPSSMRVRASVWACATDSRSRCSRARAGKRCRSAAASRQAARRWSCSTSPRRRRCSGWTRGCRASTCGSRRATRHRRWRPTCRPVCASCPPTSRSSASRRCHAPTGSTSPCWRWWPCSSAVSWCIRCWRCRWRSARRRWHCSACWG